MQLNISVETRKERAEPSQDHMLDVGSETGHQSRMMKLSDEVSVVAGLHVCAAGLSMPDQFEDTDKLGKLGHSTREPLSIDQVKEAREQGVRLMTEHGMFEIVPESEVSCVDVRLREPGVKSRQEGVGVTYKRDDVIQNTPPLSVARLLVSKDATSATLEGRSDKCIAVWDSSVALFHATIPEPIYVKSGMTSPHGAEESDAS